MLKIADKGVRRNLSNMSRIAQLGENTNDYQDNMNSNDKAKDKDESNIDNTDNAYIKYPLNRKDFEDKYYSPNKNTNINYLIAKSIINYYNTFII
jgi:hypothetical protein